MTKGCSVGQRRASVGLSGDGDEIAAMRDVEAAFDVKLDTSKAPNWHTAGDVYRALLQVLPADQADQPDLWHRFALALTRETGIDPKTIRAESPLLTESRFWGFVSTLNAMVWVAAAISIGGIIGWALVR